MDDKNIMDKIEHVCIILPNLYGMYSYTFLIFIKQNSIFSSVTKEIYKRKLQWKGNLLNHFK